MTDTPVLMCTTDSVYRERCMGARDGTYFPTDNDLRLGIPLFRGNVVNDLREFKKLRLRGDDFGALRRLVNRFLKSPMDVDHVVAFGDDLDNMRTSYQLSHALRSTDHLLAAVNDLLRRVDTYRLYVGDANFAFQYIHDAGNFVSGYQRYLAARFARRIQDAYAYGHSSQRFSPSHFPHALSSTKRDRDYDLHMQSLNEARLDADDARKAPATDDTQVDDAPDPAPAPSAPASAKIPPALVVFPNVSADGATGDRRAVLKSLECLSGKRLLLVQRGDIVDQRARLVAKFPHAVDAIDLVFRDLGTRDVVDFRPVLFHGSPGCGKTRLAREIGDVLGLPWTEYGCGGSTDSHFAGVSAGWSSARPSVPVELIRQHRFANPLVVLDELEKATRGHNGSVLDAILPFIERRQSSSVRDKALEINCDLSAVNYIATANDLNPLRGPILDRFRVVRVPDPGPQHLGDLVRTIVEDIATEKGFDPRMIEPLDGLEEALLRKVWRGGSLRRLGLAVTRLVEARDQFASVN